MSEKCVCHINGYRIKDGIARKNIEKLNSDVLATQESVLAVDNRVSNIISVSESGTNENTELIDIRTDYKGKVHTTAGDSIRAITGENANDLKSFSKKVVQSGKNLYNNETILLGIRADGSSVEGEACSEWIDVDEGETYVLSKSSSSTYTRIYSNEGSIYNGNVSTTGYSFVIPEGVTKIRFSCKAENILNYQFEKGETPTPYEPFEEYINQDMLKVDVENTSFYMEIAKGKNLYNSNDVAVGTMFNEDGSGLTISNPSYNLSNYIPVKYGDVLIGSDISGSVIQLRQFATYDENLNIVRFESGYTAIFPVVINRNERFIRFVVSVDFENLQIENNTEITPHEDFIGRTVIHPEVLPFKYNNDTPYYKNVWYGKRLVVDGDSITHDQARYDYWQFVASNILEMNIVTKDENGNSLNDYASGWKGVGGSRIANDPVESTNDPTYSIVLRYQNLPDEADIVVINGGTNDWAHGNVDLGDFDSTDNTTFNGALNILLPGLKEKYPNIPVVMMTPIKRGVYGQLNKKGLTQEQFVNAMIEKCKQYNVYCLDMWSNCPINPNITAMANTLFDADVDLVHPNTEGHKVMGKTVAGFIRTLN